MTNFGPYSVLSSRVHMNAVLGCATAAAPFRNLPEQHNDVRYMRKIRNAISFDTFGGFFSGNGELAKFYCFLPASQDVLEASDSLSISVDEEVCHKDQVIVTSSDDVLVGIGVGYLQLARSNDDSTEEELEEKMLREMFGGSEEEPKSSDEEEGDDVGDDEEGEKGYGERWRGGR